jgi:hypothetical protein
VASGVIPVSYYDPHGTSSPKFAYAFAKGCGGTMTDELGYLFDGPAAAFAVPPAWPLLQFARAQGRDVYYGDHGYFGRKKYYRITKNAYQHDGTGDATPDRFVSFRRPVQPWRTSGGHILVCPNSSVYFELHGLNVDQWLLDVRHQLAAVTDRDVRIRWKVTASPIEHDLVDCWAVVVLSSAAAIDGLIAGVPCVTLAPWAATARMGLTDLSQIETPYYPDGREPFLWNLAAQQWTIRELCDGQAWRALQEGPRVAAMAER